MTIESNNPHKQEKRRHPEINQRVPAFFYALRNQEAHRANFRFFRLLRAAAFHQAQHRASCPNSRVLLNPCRLFLNRKRAKAFTRSSFAMLFRAQEKAFLIHRRFFPDYALLNLQGEHRANQR